MVSPAYPRYGLKDIMAQSVIPPPVEPVKPVEPIEVDVSDLVTEDDTPVDNLFSEKQQRLLTESLYNSWTPTEADPPRKFLAAANVGLFPSRRQAPLVPDVFLSLDVEVAEDWWDKNHRSYFFWEFGKAPEVVVEIVSNRKGGELGSKLQAYARAGVSYYVVYDPTKQLGDDVLSAYELYVGKYQGRSDSNLPGIGLGLRLWEGIYEGKQATWLRWYDAQGQLISTGAERAAREAERAAREAERAGRLAAKLRELGVDPDQL